MLEQIHAPSEDGRKVQLMISAATAAFGLLTAFSAGMVVHPAAAIGASLALIGMGGAALAAAREPRLA
jgi:hypothetical protein